jgi:protein O-mannosyl-transferase
MFLGAVTGIVMLTARKLPYLMVGWLWYLGTLVPVIGLVQVGHQSMADRYTYIPLIGIFIMTVWGFSELLSRSKYGKAVLGTATAIVLTILMVLTWQQVGSWKDSETLFIHALAVTTNNYLAHYDLGNVLFYRGDLEGAAKQYQISVWIKPDLVEGHNNLANILLSKRNYGQAIAHYSASLRIDPHQSNVYNNLGTAYFHTGNIRKAIKYFQDAVREKPGYTEAVKNLENARIAQLKLTDMITNLQRSIKDNPKNPALYIKLGDIFRQQGEYTEAITQYQEAILIQPQTIPALYGLALVYSDLNNYSKALGMLQKVRQFQPDDSEIYYNIACIYARQNKVDDSIIWLRQAVDKGFNKWGLIGEDPDLENIRNTPFVHKLLQDNGILIK